MVAGTLIQEYRLAREPKSATRAAAPEASERKGVEWVDTQMATHFANVVNVQGTREQVDLFFGTNRTWHVTPDSGVTVELSNRVILTPLAAKRLLTVLGNVLREHEARYGTLSVE
jgi:hypothetical protein